MLRSTNVLKDYAIQATDGTIGHVKDFYFVTILFPNPIKELGHLKSIRDGF